MIYGHNSKNIIIKLLSIYTDVTYSVFKTDTDMAMLLQGKARQRASKQNE